MKRKNKIRSAALVGLFTLIMAMPQEKQGLKEIADPYLGVYTCTCATLEGKSFLPYGKGLRIELKKNGVYTLFYRNEAGKREQRKGKYTYDSQKKEVGIFSDEKSGTRQVFCVDKGKLEMKKQIGEKLLRIVFER